MKTFFWSDYQALQSHYKNFLRQYVGFFFTLFFLCCTAYADNTVLVQPINSEDQSGLSQTLHQKELNISYNQNISADYMTSSSWYEVEMIIFLNKNLVSEECWPDNIVPARPSKSAIFLKNPAQLASIHSLRELIDNTTAEKKATVNKKHELTFNIKNQLMVLLPLSENFNKKISLLNKSHQHQVLYTARWRMPIPTLGKPLTFAICPDINKNGTNELCGEITLYKKRMLYSKVNLTYPLFYNKNSTISSCVDSQNKDGIHYFPMQITSQMNLNKLTYIDNSELGILLQITPYKLMSK